MTDLASTEVSAFAPQGQTIALIDRPLTGELTFATPQSLTDILADLEKRAYEELGIPDVSTPKGREKIASVAYNVAKSKTGLIAMGKMLTEDWRKRTKDVNAECNRIEAFADDLKARIRGDLTAWENIEKDRVAAHESALIELAALGHFDVVDPASPDIRARITQVEAFVAGRDWQEFLTRADATGKKLIADLASYAIQAEKREADAAELEALRKEKLARQQREHDEEVSRAAAAEATRLANEEAERLAEIERQREYARFAEIEALAEKAERLRQEEIERAEHARIAAQAEIDRQIEAARVAEENRQEAERHRERDRVEAEQRLEDQRLASEKAAEVERQRVEKQREADAQAAKEAEARAVQAALDARPEPVAMPPVEVSTVGPTPERKAEVEAIVKKSLSDLGISALMVSTVLRGLVEGKIAHVRIEY